ncbi:MAG: hypothetical protein U0992_11375 [Planctomycetaceae bacterium]
MALGYHLTELVVGLIWLLVIVVFPERWWIVATSFAGSSAMSLLSQFAQGRIAAFDVIGMFVLSYGIFTALLESLYWAY